MRQAAFFVTAVITCLYGAIGTIFYSLLRGFRDGNWTSLTLGSLMPVPRSDLQRLKPYVAWIWATPLWVLLCALAVVLMLTYYALVRRNQFDAKIAREPKAERSRS